MQNLEMEIKFFVMLGTQRTLLGVNLEFREEKVVESAVCVMERVVPSLIIITSSNPL